MRIPSIDGFRSKFAVNNKRKASSQTTLRNHNQLPIQYTHCFAILRVQPPYHPSAGVAAAIISHPADTLLSKVNRAGAGGTGSTTSRLINIAKEVGFYKLCTTGLGARCVMIGGCLYLLLSEFLLLIMLRSCTRAR